MPIDIREFRDLVKKKYYKVEFQSPDLSTCVARCDAAPFCDSWEIEVLLENDYKCREIFESWVNTTICFVKLRREQVIVYLENETIKTSNLIAYEISSLDVCRWGLENQPEWYRVKFSVGQNLDMPDNRSGNIELY